MSRLSSPRSTLFVLALVALVASASPSPSLADEENCPAFDPLKQPYFGTTHLHTGRSFDASIRFVPSTPREAYAFAKGERDLPMVGVDGRPIEPLPALDRPLDWGLVTDHSEYFGEVGICQHDRKGKRDSKIPNRYALDCQLLDGFYWQVGVGMPPGQMRSNASNAFGILVLPTIGPSSHNAQLPVCVNNSEECAKAETRVWDEMQQAANHAYEPCTFTSFIGYEMSSTPLGTNWHRNVIFANENVIEAPITGVDLARQENPDPQTDPPLWLVKPKDGLPPGGVDITKLWTGLRDQCVEAGTGCDVLTIPHNSNLGGGIAAGNVELVPPLFFNPLGATVQEKADFARMMNRYQPLVEIYQDKGSSECRWDPRFGEGVGTNDELCDFEILDTTTILGTVGVSGGEATALAPDQINPRSYVRNVFKDGLAQQEEIGVNPFKMGVVAASDSHNGTMGWHPEDASYRGHLGIEDAVPVLDTNIQNSSGGHSVAWAEENTRESIFAALRRQETYGTSGPRMRVRFFGGSDFDASMCETTPRQMIERGYRDGVPMGGDLAAGDLPGEDDVPTFVAAAWWDDELKTPLQRVQVIKGWVTDAEGARGHSNCQPTSSDDDTTFVCEAVIDVAGGPSTASVDASCEPTGERGEPFLCGVFRDDDFDPERPAFYYVRVLEDPVCRYSTLYCQENYNVNPLDPGCENQLAALQRAGSPQYAYAANCCNTPASPLYVQPVIQERAWTSPIWYTPEATE